MIIDPEELVAQGERKMTWTNDFPFFPLHGLE